MFFEVIYRVSMQDQNQNVQPDYGFIVNQQMPDAQKPKRSRRKFILIAGGLFIFVSLFAASIFAAIQGNVQETTSNEIADATITEFYDAVKAQDYEKASTLLKPVTGQVGPTSEEISKVFTVFDASTCKVDSAETDQNVSRVLTSCQSYDKKFVMKFNFDVAKVNDIYIITQGKAEYVAS